MRNGDFHVTWVHDCGEDVMSQHAINARKAMDDAETWEKMAHDAEENAARYRSYAFCRRRDAADYQAMADREQKEIEQVYAAIGEGK